MRVPDRLILELSDSVFGDVAGPGCAESLGLRDLHEAFSVAPFQSGAVKLYRLVQAGGGELHVVHFNLASPHAMRKTRPFAAQVGARWTG